MEFDYSEKVIRLQRNQKLDKEKQKSKEEKKYIEQEEMPGYIILINKKKV